MLRIEMLLYEQLFSKIKDNSVVAVFGACTAGERILRDIKKYKRNVTAVCFIDNCVKGSYVGLPVYSLKEFINQNLKCDMVIMSTMNNVSVPLDILRIYGYDILLQTRFVYLYYRMYKDNFEKILEIFENEEDKELYKLLLNVRLGLEAENILAKYYNYKFSSDPIICRQYLDKINKNAVKTILDLGLNSGINVVAYDKFLPNLEKVYGFEAIYELCEDKVIQSFIEKGKLEVVKSCVGNEKGEISFLYDPNGSKTSAFSKDISTKIRNIDGWKEITVPMIDIDSFVEERNIDVDLIKADIEGAELSALKGAIKTIKKFRPQLAISIYHSDKDFIEIPLYLKENLVNYTFKLEHYCEGNYDTVLYAVPNELN